MLKLIKLPTLLLLTLFFITITSISYAGLDDKSLVLYLSFDEGAGNTAKDGSVYGHDGELMKGPKWVDGKSDKAIEFDGTKSQYVIVPINDTLQLREQFSVAFWVKRGNTQISAWNYMVAGGSLKWAVIFNKDNQKTFVYTNGGGWGLRGQTDGAQPEDWVHITLTHDTKSAVNIYYDGKRAGGGGKPPTVAEIDGSVMVGARHPGREFFTGVIDEVYLFDRIITVDEINTIKDGGFTPVKPADKLTTTWGVIKANRHW